MTPPRLAFATPAETVPYPPHSLHAGLCAAAEAARTTPQLHLVSHPAADAAAPMAERRILAEQSADAAQSAEAAQSADFLRYRGGWGYGGASAFALSTPWAYGPYWAYRPVTADSSYYNAVASQPRNYW